MMWLEPFSKECLECWLSNDCGTQYQAPCLAYLRVWFEKLTTLSIQLYICLMIQVLIHDCHEMKNETRYMGAAIIALTKTIWAQARYRSAHSRTD